MSKSIKYLLLIVASFFLISCQQSEGTSGNDKTDSDTTKEQNKVDEGEDDNMSEIDIYDFKNIEKAPKAAEKQPLDNVIKIFFDETSIDDPYQAIAIDIKNNEIYKNPIISRRGLRAQDGVIEVNNTAEVNNILEKHNVQNWEEDYTFEDAETYEDGYSWRLWLQYEDGTIEKHGGKGTDIVKLTPDNFTAFVDELREFEKRKIEGK
ncbi:MULTISPECIES: hypothetical protein [Oceanobacillus]|uniref:Lipoprotein n=1 Tax=Oceanobacillus kimchii TaxID=746691 RepID=A0ABQ5TKQ7_9BACI|nr:MULTISPECIES: hypothetical protein [Oceanobacillus]MBT2600384.1 hypothetical protein [Oceanobacillus sp. ISL-74]MBT2650542.1 hypothetical protein [Oceanobacillus sp. ISL-73]MCT1578283.1 hypothetical protein [Oceanobacillus kimchii]MCT2134461.1 hypothetical protein [Oceanobacillus kimchii]OEH54916.1 hypothetical protein AQ616_07660 [Oceanobacillus sp. E9]